MRIDSNPGGQPLPAATENANSSLSSSTAAEAALAWNAAALASEDQAQFSGAHVQIQAQVQALAAQAAQLPEVNQAKVEALRQSVLEGTYETNAGQIADALFSNMVEPIAA